MAKLNATVNVKETIFRFSISDISKLNEPVWSPVYLIDGVPWRVYATKNILGAKPALGLSLYCAKLDSSSNWSHVASATFELLSFKSSCASTKREACPYVFDHSSKQFGFSQFIQWDKLFDAKNGYVKDDTIDLRIEIRAEPNKAKISSFERISKSCDDGCLSTFRVAVSNVESITAVKTSEFILRKIPCELLLFKHANYLGIQLFFKLSQSVSQVGKLFAILTADSVSSDDGTRRCEKVQGAIDRNNFSLFLPQLISWDELLEPKNGFMKDGAITIELEIKTELLQDGSEPNAKKRKTANDTPVEHLKLECEICKKPITNQDISSLPCGHMFCSPCITESLKIRKACPSCDVRANQNGLRRILLPTPKSN